MNETDVAARLAEALHESLCSCEKSDAGTGFWIRDADTAKALAALLPVVREIGEVRESEGYWRGYRDGIHDGIALRGEAPRG